MTVKASRKSGGSPYQITGASTSGGLRRNLVDSSECSGRSSFFIPTEVRICFSNLHRKFLVLNRQCLYLISDFISVVLVSNSYIESLSILKAVKAQSTETRWMVLKQCLCPCSRRRLVPEFPATPGSTPSDSWHLVSSIQSSFIWNPSSTSCLRLDSNGIESGTHMIREGS